MYESIGEDCATLDHKDYVHVGVAVDTPSGLLVPVLRDVDKRAFADIVAELAALAEKARTKGLSIEEMSGSSMCLSSLGHNRGTGFPPFINAPAIAILGSTPHPPNEEASGRARGCMEE